MKFLKNIGGPWPPPPTLLSVAPPLFNSEKQTALCDTWLSVRNGRRRTKRVAELLKAHRNQSKKDHIHHTDKLGCNKVQHT